MLKRILKPSFRLKSAHTVVFSSCGNYLAHLQDYARITLWDIKERDVIAKYKLIKNESYIGFSVDSSKMYCKNSNGELVFFETLTGKVISETGEFKMSRLGGCAQFMSDDRLIDGDSNGQIIVWNTDDSSVKSSIEYENHMIRGVKGLSGKYYVALVYPKHDEKSSGCRLMKFNEPVNLKKFELIKPNDESHRYLDNWKDISKFCFSTKFNDIFLILDKENQSSHQVLVQQNLQSNQSCSRLLDNPDEHVWSISTNDKYIFVVVWTNLYKKGMNHKEYQELIAKTPETKHIHIFEINGLKRVAKIYWPDVYSLTFHPNNRGVAIAADKNSVYLDDYSDLLNL